MPPRSAPDTEELLIRVKKGSQSAVEELLARHRDRLRRTIAVRLDSRLLARLDPSDVVQDTLLEAAQKLPDYARRRPLPFYPWLRQLAWDRLVELHQKHIRTGKRSVQREEAGLALSEDSAWQLAQQLANSETGPGQRLLRKELCQRVQAGLSELPPGDREILVMRHLEQLHVSEIAALLKISEGAVKMRRLRAMLRLRELLESDRSEDES